MNCRMSDTEMFDETLIYHASLSVNPHRKQREIGKLWLPDGDGASRACEAMLCRRHNGCSVSSSPLSIFAEGFGAKTQRADDATQGQWSLLTTEAVIGLAALSPLIGVAAMAPWPNLNPLAGLAALQGGYGGGLHLSNGYASTRSDLGRG